MEEKIIWGKKGECPKCIRGRLTLSKNIITNLWEESCINCGYTKELPRKMAHIDLTYKRASRGRAGVSTNL